MGGPECGDVNSEKSDLWYNRSAWKKMIKELEEDEAALMEEKNYVYKQFAKEALEYYNKEQGVDYELEKIIVGDWVDNGLLYHVNYQAKLRNSTSPPELFFSEIVDMIGVTCCTILEPEPEEISAAMILGKCELCPVPVLHPDSGFCAVHNPLLFPRMTREEFIAHGKRLLEEWIRDGLIVGSEDEDEGADMVDEDEMNLKKCEKAIEYYNEEKGVDYEFVEFLNGDSSSRLSLRCYHVNFGAKLKNSTSPTELFFAELVDRNTEDRFEVMHCTILEPEPEEIPGDLIVVCESCSVPIRHPEDGFSAGFWKKKLIPKGG